MEHVSVLKIGPILLVTIQTELHNRATEQLQKTVIEKIEETGASGVLIDITALDMVDLFGARVLSDTACMASIMDVKVVLVGMRPAVTMTLVEMGLNLTGIARAVDIEMGLEALGYRLEPIERQKEDRSTIEAEVTHHEVD